MILSYRKDIIEVIAIDILLKKIRRIACKDTLQNCSICKKGSCLSPEDINRVISTHSKELLESINVYENNSFSLPWRGIIFQDIIDEYLPDNISITYFEIGCASGSLGKVLTNSNYARSYFKHNQESLNKRETNYYGVDPNLILNINTEIANVTGSSEKSHQYREDIKKFEFDESFSTQNIKLEKKS